QERLRAGKVYPQERVGVALENFFRADKLAALRELALREVADDVEARRVARELEPLSRQAVGERVLALVEPQPKSQRIMRRAWRSAQRLGTTMDALWVRKPGRPPTEEEATQLAALRRVASILGPHFIEEEGDDLVDAVRRVAAERGSTYVFVGTPDESRRREILRLAPLPHGAGAARHRHPRRRQPRRPGQAGRMIAAVISLAALSAVLAGALVARSGVRFRRPRAGTRRILVPFTGGTLDETVLSAAIRIARAQEATLVPAYLLRVPLQYPEDSPLASEVEVALPLLEAVEHAALREGVPVDARIEKGRTPTHALRRLWEVERFDWIVAPAPANGNGGFGPKDVSWILANSPSETIVLKPAPHAG